MIILSVAMYPEAKPFIEHLNLKKDMDVKRFQVFKNDETVLIISGVGAIASSIATTYIMTYYNVGHSDLFINTGICGSRDKRYEVGSGVMCHKIIHHDTKRAFYTDMIFRHPFKEGVLETFSTVVNNNMEGEVEGDIVDMEGAGAYQAASFFLPSHQIYCIKIVSDYLRGESVTPHRVSELIGYNVPVISSWMLERARAIKPSKDILDDDEVICLKNVCKNLKLTSAMEHDFLELAKRYKVRSGNLIDALKPFLDIECKSKNEGKIQFGRLREKLIES